MKNRSKLYWLLAIVLIVILSVWISIRWKAWFDNPPEEPYTVSVVPSRVLLTFGDEGESSRYVSWMCGSQVSPNASVSLAIVGGDTISFEAIGEVFISRSGQAAYYRALLTGIEPDQEYVYRVTTGAHSSPWYRFSTSDPEAVQFSFLYMGDVQDTIGGIANHLLREAIRRHPEVEFVAFGGDLIERPTDRFWNETFRSIDSVCTAMPVINITGNHDYLKYLIRKCERRFSLVFPYFLRGMDERDDENHLFCFTYHNTDFFLLDSDRGPAFLYAQRQWLKEQLSSSRSPHRIALLHHPLYSVKRKNNNLEVRWMFNDLLQEAGVDLVLQGHEHAYAHCTANEHPLTGHLCQQPPLYVVSHCSPKNYSIHPTERFFPVLNDSRYYQVVTVQRDAVVLRSFDAADNVLVDSVRIESDCQ